MENTLQCAYDGVFIMFYVSIYCFIVHNRECSICNALSLSPQITKHCAVWALCTHTQTHTHIHYLSTSVSFTPSDSPASRCCCYFFLIVLLSKPKATDSSFFIHFQLWLTTFNTQLAAVKYISERFHIKLCTWSRTFFIER